MPDNQLVTLVPVPSLEQEEGFFVLVALHPCSNRLCFMNPLWGDAEPLRQKSLLGPRLGCLGENTVAVDELPHCLLPYTAGRGDKALLQQAILQLPPSEDTLPDKQPRTE